MQAEGGEQSASYADVVFHRYSWCTGGSVTVIAGHGDDDGIWNTAETILAKSLAVELRDAECLANPRAHEIGRSMCASCVLGDAIHMIGERTLSVAILVVQTMDDPPVQTSCLGEIHEAAARDSGGDPTGQLCAKGSDLQRSTLEVFLTHTHGKMRVLRMGGAVGLGCCRVRHQFCRVARRTAQCALCVGRKKNCFLFVSTNIWSFSCLRRGMPSASC